MLCLQRQENHIYLDKGLRGNKMHHFSDKGFKTNIIKVLKLI